CDLADARVRGFVAVRLGLAALVRLVVAVLGLVITTDAVDEAAAGQRGDQRERRQQEQGTKRPSDAHVPVSLRERLADVRHSAAGYPGQTRPSPGSEPREVEHLAELLQPHRVVGLDLPASDVDRARGLAVD